MRKLWSEEEIDKLKTDYPTRKSEDIANELGRSLRSVYTYAKLLGLKKSEEFKNSPLSGRLTRNDIRAGIGSRFKKGNVPPNTGKKAEEFMTPNQLAKFKANQFKKGDNPHNACKDWEERIVQYNDGNKYIRIKVPGIRKLVFKHVWIYLKENDSIPEGHVIAFKDGDSMNCEPENLIAITRQKNMKRNSIMRFPEELRSLIRLLSKLNNKIKNEKQD